MLCDLFNDVPNVTLVKCLALLIQHLEVLVNYAPLNLRI